MAGADRSLEARALDLALMRLMATRQRYEADLAGRLRHIASRRDYFFVHGFSSMEAFARERYGLSPRRLYYMMALDRTLERLPALRRAFVSGRLTLKQVLLLGSVATAGTVETWEARARALDLRQLEDEVAFWNHLKEVRPEVWESLEGGPLPEGLILEPGLPPRLHASAREEAATFMKALASSEGEIPLPDHLCRLRMRVEPEVKAMWDDFVSRCRAEVRPDIPEGDALALLMAAFWRIWDNDETRRQRRENPILERSAWRCSAPGCRAMGTGKLQVHHVLFRSQGGTDDAWNETAVCGPHHHRGIHRGVIRSSGRAPDDLRWEMGCAPGMEPFLVYHGGTRVGGVAP
jgi:hypothetical protein